MNEAASPAPRKRRPGLLALGWILLAASVLLCIGGPHLFVSDVPADIRSRMGDADWGGFAWIIAGILVGALGLMCFAVEWAFRPGRMSNAHQQKGAKSK